ncbi:unnamed protein product [Lepeophtheirus salmonis]|uniref:(salmon louse) hypothetical protein n=1 Tax=Lepeophtheirus salmonis TaxID=72036 RepID=A0A7R8HCY6_LEPSM|nr:unnamed protein product [Lepeophtheirus salmonis]CAF3000326.1 unnamed protein product [Lepeophtheirus salmonis]
MSLVVKLIGFNGSGTGGDRIAKATFRVPDEIRAMTVLPKTLTSTFLATKLICQTVADLAKYMLDGVDEDFIYVLLAMFPSDNIQLDWPIASPLQRDENISIHIMAFNRFLNNRLLGNTTFSLHRLLDQPTVQLAASLLDMNGIPLKASIKLEMSYYSPFSYEDDSVDELEAEDDDNIRSYISDDLSDNKALVSIERNIANIERNFNRRQDEGSHGDEESLMNRDSDSVGVPSDIEASFSEEAPLLEKPSFSKEIIQETNKNESVKQRSQSKR